MVVTTAGDAPGECRVTREIPLLGICARNSGMGKTTLLTRLLPRLTAGGLRISVVKQTHAGFDLDRPGKDSHRMREAGAAQVLLSAPERWALLTEAPPRPDDERLLEVIAHLDAGLADLILVEGFREAPIPKIEVYRRDCKSPPLAAGDGTIVAIASDAPIPLGAPCFHLDDIEGMACFVRQWLARENAGHHGHSPRRPAAMRRTA